MRITFLLTVFYFSTAIVSAQDLTVTDRNGDGVTSLMAFGDSITSGVGDGAGVGEFVEQPTHPGNTFGYPGRIELASGLLVDNSGSPGEELSSGGSDRIPNAVGRSNADTVVLLEGSNDAVRQVPNSVYRKSLQRSINVTRALGKDLILATLPRVCCRHDSLGPFADGYSDIVRDLAFKNNLELADVELAWDTSSDNPAESELINIPEGLHPNTKGYDVIAQTILGAMYGIDLFSEGGAAELESALGLAPGTVVVRPPVSQEVP